MKARPETNSETTYNNESFETFTPSSTDLQCAVNGDSINKEPLRSDSNELSNFLCEDSQSGKFPPAAYSVISDYPSPENGLYPLHFNTSEALDKTPAIFKSLNSTGRGPDTFVYNSPHKPLSLQWNEDSCKTFVITSEKWESKNQKNSNSAVNGGSEKPGPDEEENTYLSYVIEKSEKMSEKKSWPNEDSTSFEGSDETNRVDDANCQKKESEGDEKEGLHESEYCDIKVQSENEKTAEENADLSFDRTLTGKKEQTFARLQDELQKAHKELKLKVEEVTRLTRIREDVERELEELTASLFQEAHKMVSKAKEKQVAAEKSLKESQMKVEVLTAEVIALKTLVLTSTPSRPNPHLHPQIGKEENFGGVNLFNKKHRRSPSHFNLKYGRENSPPESPARGEQNSVQNSVSSSIGNRDIPEVDPTVHKEFVNWALTCKFDKTDPFIDRIYREDINLCLDFSNRELSEEVQKAIETRNIFIEAVTDKTKTIFPRKCALLEVTRQCHYRMKLGDQDTWYSISQMCRNRIIAVCDFINYLRYIELGLVKSSAQDMYWEIMRLRKEMILARLGLSLPPP